MLPVRILLHYVGSFLFLFRPCLSSSSTSTGTTSPWSLLLPGDPFVQLTNTTRTEWLSVYPSCSDCISQGNQYDIISGLQINEYLTSSFLRADQANSTMIVSAAVYGPPSLSAVEKNSIEYEYTAGEYFSYILSVQVPIPISTLSSYNVYSVWYFPESYTLPSYYYYPFYPPTDDETKSSRTNSTTIHNGSFLMKNLLIQPPSHVRLCRYHNNTMVQVLIGNTWGVSTVYFHLSMRTNDGNSNSNKTSSNCSPVLESSIMTNTQISTVSSGYYTVAINEPVDWQLQISSDSNPVHVRWFLNNSLLWGTNVTIGSVNFLQNLPFRTNFSYEFTTVHQNQVWNITILITNENTEQYLSKEWLIIPRGFPLLLELTMAQEQDIYVSESSSFINWTNILVPLQGPQAINTFYISDVYSYRWFFPNGMEYLTTIPELHVPLNDSLHRIDGTVYISVTNEIGNQTIPLYTLHWLRGPLWINVPDNHTYIRYGQVLELFARVQGYNVQCIWKRLSNLSIIVLSNTSDTVIINNDWTTASQYTSSVHIMYSPENYRTDSDTLRVICWNTEGMIEGSSIDVTLLPLEWLYVCDSTFVNLPLASVDWTNSITQPLHRPNTLLVDYFPFRLYYTVSLSITVPRPSSSLSTMHPVQPCEHCTFTVHISIQFNNVSLCGWDPDRIQINTLPLTYFDKAIVADEYVSFELNQSESPYSLLFSTVALPPEELNIYAIPTNLCTISWSIEVIGKLPSSKLVPVPNNICQYSVTIPIAPALESMNPSLLYNSTWLRPLDSATSSVPVTRDNLYRIGEAYLSRMEYNILIPGILTGAILGLVMASISITNYLHLLDHGKKKNNHETESILSTATVRIRYWLQIYSINIRWKTIWEWIQFAIILDQGYLLYHVSLTKYLSVFSVGSGLLPSTIVPFFSFGINTSPGYIIDEVTIDPNIYSFTQNLVNKVSGTQTLSIEELNILSLLTVPYQGLDRFSQRYNNPLISRLPFHSLFSILTSTVLMIGIVSILLFLSVIIILHRIRQASYSIVHTTSTHKIRLIVYPRKIGHIYTLLLQNGLLYLYQPIAFLAIILALGISILNTVHYLILVCGITLLLIYLLFTLRRGTRGLPHIVYFTFIAVILNLAYFTKNSYLFLCGLLVVYIGCGLYTARKWQLLKRNSSLSGPLKTRKIVVYESQIIQYLLFGCILLGHFASIVNFGNIGNDTDASLQARYIESTEASGIFTIIIITAVLVSLLFTKLFLPLQYGVYCTENVSTDASTPSINYQPLSNLKSSTSVSSTSIDSVHPSTAFFSSSKVPSTNNSFDRRNIVAHGKGQNILHGKTRMVLTDSLTDDIDKVFDVLKLTTVPKVLPYTLYNYLYQWYRSPVGMLVYTLTKVLKIITIRVPSTIIPVSSPLLNYPRSHLRTFLPTTVALVTGGTGLSSSSSVLLSRVSRSIEQVLSRISRSETVITNENKRINEPIIPAIVTTPSDDDHSFSTTNPYYNRSLPSTKGMNERSVSSSLGNGSKPITLSSVAAKVAKLNSSTAAWRTPWDIAAAGQQDFMVINYPSRAPVVKRNNIDITQLSGSIDYSNRPDVRRNSVIVHDNVMRNQQFQRRSRSASATLDPSRIRIERDVDDYEDMPPLENEITGEVFV